MNQRRSILFRLRGNFFSKKILWMLLAVQSLVKPSSLFFHHIKVLLQKSPVCHTVCSRLSSLRCGAAGSQCHVFHPKVDSAIRRRVVRLCFYCFFLDGGAKLVCPGRGGGASPVPPCHSCQLAGRRQVHSVAAAESKQWLVPQQQVHIQTLHLELLFRSHWSVW